MPTQIRPTFHAELIRPDDLLHLQVDGSNFRLIQNENRGPLLTVGDRERPAFLRFTFAPQTITESAFFEAALVPGAIPSTPITPENDPTKRKDLDQKNITIRDPLLVPSVRKEKFWLRVWCGY